MRHYLDLIPISAKMHKKQSRMTRLCIVLAVFLVTVIFGMADMEMRSQKIQAIQSDGEWHAGFRNITEEQAGILAARPEIKSSAWYDVCNYRLDEGYQLEGTDTVICGFDEEFIHMFPVSEIAEGTFPQDTNSAAFSKSVKERLGLNVGDTVSLTTPEGKVISLTASGFTGNTSLLTQNDAFGVFLNMETYRNLFSQGSAVSSDGMFYVKFVPYCNIQKALADIQTQFGLADQQIAQNTKLLALMLQSEDPYMIQLYITAAILAVLVTIAGTLMIASSLNSNIMQRTEFFGMMRCLGATRKQIIRFVRREALIWCKTAIPLGIFGATVVIWLLCAMLKFLSPSLFSGMPTFGISWLGLVFGVLVGLITVLLAASSPAKKAARVSPLTAVSGNAGSVQLVKKAANTKMFSVQTALGIHHAKGSKKNYLLMTGSFAFSIILFLAFRPAVDFMNHSITPLKPYTPDLTFTSADNSCSIPEKLAKELQNAPGVKRAYGRSFAYQMPAAVSGEPRTITLISYETCQFDWAKDMLLEGTVTDVSHGTSVLTVYQSGAPLAVGSTMELETPFGKRQLTVSGVLSHSPFSQESGVDTMICSEKLFQELTGESGYTVLDLQLTRKAQDEDVARIRQAAGDTLVFSDRRMSNEETKGAYYSFTLFIYGFLAVIALITIFNIINSIGMSVSARLGQYGAMRAIGMSNQQLLRMIGAEAVTYGISGIVLGCAVGLPLNNLLFRNLVTFRWGDPWYLPVGALALIILVVLGSLALAVRGPARRIRNLSIVDTISAE
jgi:putative ABC transport system permease protein